MIQNDCRNSLLNGKTQGQTQTDATRLITLLSLIQDLTKLSIKSPFNNSLNTERMQIKMIFTAEQETHAVFQIRKLKFPFARNFPLNINLS